MELGFLLNQAQSMKIELDKFRPFDAEREARVVQKLRLDWNYHSNHLEGGKLTYGETKALILFGITAQGKPLQDHLETSGHDEAILWIEDVVKKQVQLTEVFIRQLHELILKNPYQKRAITPDNKEITRWIKIGVYKSEPNHVRTQTGEIFRFATPEETPALMNDLLNWYNEKKENKEINPVLFAAEFHYRFIRIHPFDDGNGRLARILMNFILLQSGYPPAIIKSEDKENYFAALRQADAGMFEPFAGYIAENVIRSLEIMIKGIKGENIEDPDDLDKEIVLLEHKLNGGGDVIEKIKSEETLRDWFEKTLPPLVLKFITVNEKFKNFYVDRVYGLFYYELGNLVYVDDYSDLGEDNEPHQEYREEKVSLLLTNLVDKDEVPLRIIITPQTKEFNRENFLEKIANLENDLIEVFLLGDKRLSLKLICRHNIFNRPDIVEPFNYEYKISIYFDKTKYYLSGEQSKHSITKLYHQRFTDEEINYILKSEADIHLKFVKDTIEKDKLIEEDDLPF
ncbi:MAG: Fic family protein [Bacteroidia bacterium]|nr:Fic family protein [Bacteroidia bacterium]